MSEYFDGFMSAPRRARQARTLRPTGTATKVRTDHLNDEFFDGFFAGPRAVR
jgi:hypothetical protein